MIKSQCYINVLYRVYVVTLAGDQSMLHQIIGDFGVSDAIDEISVWGCKLDFGPAWLNENPWKSRKCPLWFGDSFASWCHVLIFFSFPGLQAIDDYKNLRLKMKLGKGICLPFSWSNPYNFLTTVVQHRRLDHGILSGFWLEFEPLSKMATLIPKLSVIAGAW